MNWARIVKIFSRISPPRQRIGAGSRKFIDNPRLHTYTFLYNKNVDKGSQEVI